MKLITEEIEGVEVLTEEKNGKRSFWIQGPFLQADVKNRNGRIYESRILDPAVHKYIDGYVSKSRAVGELGHPAGPAVNLDRVSHKITNLYKEGSNWMGKAKILDTPMGRIASSLLSDGVQLGVSSRGMGSLVQRDGANYVGEDYMIATVADIVADPSAPSAFVQGIMEGVEFYYDTYGKLVCADSAKKSIEDAAASRQLTEERQLEIFQQYLRSL
jgi:hypothetical protein